MNENGATKNGFLQFQGRLSLRDLLLIISLLTGGGATWHSVETQGALGKEVAVLRADLKKCDERLDKFEKSMMPGPNPGGTTTGPPPVIAPDTTRKLTRHLVN